MLTAAQMRIYEFIRENLKTGMCPTYRGIADANGNSSTGSAYSTVTRICQRGWLKRQNGRIALLRDLPAPTVTAEFDYFAVDYEHLNSDGWPRLVGIDA